MQVYGTSIQVYQLSDRTHVLVLLWILYGTSIVVEFHPFSCFFVRFRFYPMSQEYRTTEYPSSDASARQECKRASAPSGTTIVLLTIGRQHNLPPKSAPSRESSIFIKYPRDGLSHILCCFRRGVLRRLPSSRRAPELLCQWERRPRLSPHPSYPIIGRFRARGSESDR